MLVSCALPPPGGSPSHRSTKAARSNCKKCMSASLTTFHNKHNCLELAAVTKIWLVTRRSNDQINQTEFPYLQSCLWLVWESDMFCTSSCACGYRTRKLRLGLDRICQGALYRNGFASTQLDVAERYTKKGTLGEWLVVRHIK